MVCRHAPGDQECSSTVGGRAQQREQEYNQRLHQDKVKKLEDEIASTTPDPTRYEILQVEQVGSMLVAMIQYPNCTKCFFDAKKIMVFPSTSVEDAVYWKYIDPHFGDPTEKITQGMAPVPIARFPGNEEGWEDALLYASIKSKK